MTDIPLLLIDHGAGVYSLADHGDRIVLEKVSLAEIVNFLEDRDARLYPPEDAWEEAWDRTHPPVEPPIDLHIEGPAIFSLTMNADGRLTVTESGSGEVLASDVSMGQVFQALKEQ